MIASKQSTNGKRKEDRHRDFLTQISKSPTVGRQFFRTLFEQASHAICVTDRQGQILMVNSEMERLSGYREKELLGKTTKMLQPEDHEFKLKINDLTGGEDAIIDSYRLRQKNGSDVPIRIRFTLLDGIADKDFLVETFSDLSDRLRVDQLKNEFVFVAAHELRNPVTAIKLLLDIIFDDKRLAVEPTMREYLSKIQEANERLSHLVDDLLEVSRTESNRLKIKVTPQDITKHVDTIVGQNRPSAVSKSLTITYQPAGQLPLVLADKMKLKEILSNLISNAIKYNVTGGVITIEHSVKGKMVWTSIKDTGIGIRKEDRDRLFEKFWRSEDMAVRAQAGTGLGLFIVQELVHRMGGEIEFLSRYGKGTTFSFSLPIAE